MGQTGTSLSEGMKLIELGKVVSFELKDYCPAKING